MKLHHHVSTGTDAATRGAELAATFAQELRSNTLGYLKFFSELGLSEHQVQKQAEFSLTALLDWRPELAAELCAVANGIGMKHWQLAAVNARTEVLAAAGVMSHECSTLAYAPLDAAAWSIQTWDWHPSLVQDGLIWQLQSESGRAVKMFTEFGAQGKIGLNDAGIGVHFNILSHQSDTSGQGVPVHSIARAVLEEATSLDQARELVRSAKVTASTALTVLQHTATGSDVRSFELTPSGVGEVPAAQNRFLTRTNHFLSPELAVGETVAFGESKTLERLTHLHSVNAETLAASDSARTAAEALYADGAGEMLCFVPNEDLPGTEQWKTLATIFLDLPAAAIEIAAHAPGPAEISAFSRI